MDNVNYAGHPQYNYSQDFTDMQSVVIENELQIRVEEEEIIISHDLSPLQSPTDSIFYNNISGDTLSQLIQRSLEYEECARQYFDLQQENVELKQQSSDIHNAALAETHKLAQTEHNMREQYKIGVNIMQNLRQDTEKLRSEGLNLLHERDEKIRTLIENNKKGNLELDQLQSKFDTSQSKLRVMEIKLDESKSELASVQTRYEQYRISSSQSLTQANSDKRLASEYEKTLRNELSTIREQMSALRYTQARKIDELNSLINELKHENSGLRRRAHDIISPPPSAHHPPAHDIRSSPPSAYRPPAHDPPSPPSPPRRSEVSLPPRRDESRDSHNADELDPLKMMFKSLENALDPTKRIPFFTGHPKQDLFQWLSTVDRIAKLKNWNSCDIFANIGSVMKKQAGELYETASLSGIDNMTDFTKLLHERFSPHNVSDHYTTKFMEITQLRFETIPDYNARFQKSLTDFKRVNDKQLDVSFIISIYRKSLYRIYQVKLLEHKPQPTTLQEACVITREAYYIREEVFSSNTSNNKNFKQNSQPNSFSNKFQNNNRNSPGNRPQQHNNYSQNRQNSSQQYRHTQSNTQQNQKKGFCFICFDPSHYADKCPNRTNNPANQRNYSQDIRTRNNNDHNSHNNQSFDWKSKNQQKHINIINSPPSSKASTHPSSPPKHTKVEIHPRFEPIGRFELPLYNGIKTTCIFDSGSVSSLISEKFYRTLPKDPLIQVQLGEFHSSHNLQSANSSPLSTTGTILLPLQLGTQVVQYPFFIATDLNVPIILGNEFLKFTNAIWDFKSNSVSLQNFDFSLTTINTTHSPDSSSQHKSDSPRNTDKPKVNDIMHLKTLPHYTDILHVHQNLDDNFSDLSSFSPLPSPTFSVVSAGDNHFLATSSDVFQIN
jgi:hypothetical protein